MNPEQQRVRKTGAFKPIIPLDQYSESQRLVKLRSKAIDEGRDAGTAQRFPQEKKETDDAGNQEGCRGSKCQTLSRRFGSVIAAYRQIGCRAEEEEQHERARAYGTNP